MSLITCSNCGVHRALDAHKDPADAIRAGWNSCGDALYCPECSRTWSERNPGRAMSSLENTYFKILKKIGR